MHRFKQYITEVADGPGVPYGLEHTDPDSYEAEFTSGGVRYEVKFEKEEDTFMFSPSDLDTLRRELGDEVDDIEEVWEIAFYAVEQVSPPVEDVEGYLDRMKEKIRKNKGKIIKRQMDSFYNEAVKYNESLSNVLNYYWRELLDTEREWRPVRVLQPAALEWARENNRKDIVDELTGEARYNASMVNDEDVHQEIMQYAIDHYYKPELRKRAENPQLSSFDTNPHRVKNIFPKEAGKYEMVYNYKNNRKFHTTSIINSGNAGEVLSTMSHVVKDFIYREAPQSLYFTAAEKSRQKVYNHLMKRVVRKMRGARGILLDKDTFVVIP